MKLFLSILFIVYCKATNYQTLLRNGQRRFTSSDNIQSTNGMNIEYDITLVKGYHSLDHDPSVAGIYCEKDSIILYSKKPLSAWKIGDVFTGNGQWGCGDGISRKVVSFTFKTSGSGIWQYDIKTTEAGLEDLFEKATIQCKLPQELINQQKKQSTAMIGDSTWSHTFETTKTITLINKRSLTSTLTGTVSIPVTINGISVTVDSNKNTKTYQMSLHAGLDLSVELENIIKTSLSGSGSKDLFKFTQMKIPLLIGPIEITIKLQPKLTASLSYSFSASATAILSYKKTYAASIVFDSEAENKLVATASDTSKDAKPQLVVGATMNGHCTPEIQADLDIDVCVYGIGVVSGTPSLNFQLIGTLQGRSASITPKLIFNYSVQLLIWKNSGSYTLLDGPTKTITF